MKILHTADLHLKDIGNERWDALKNIIRIANDNDCQVITISGDLFDTGMDAEKIRAELRGLFSKTGARILIIPGNHDKNVYKEGYHFGDNVEVIRRGDPVRIDRCVFWGLPFENYNQYEVLENLYALKRKIDEMKDNDEIHFLLIHGELIDSLFSINDFGEEGYDRYMPFRLSYFDEMGVDFVLAGHFHTNCTVRQFHGGFFIYPGSPVSITRRETGKRKVVIVDTENSNIEEIVTDGFYYELKEIYLDPFERKNPLDIVKKALSDINENASLILKVSGYINKSLHGLDEVAFHRGLIEHLDNLNLRYPPQCEENYRDISTILEDELFKEFEKRLENNNFEKEKLDRLKELFIKAMIKSIQG